MNSGRTVRVDHNRANEASACPGRTKQTSPKLVLGSDELAMTEGGQSLDYTVKLDTDPGDGNTVRVDITGHSGTDLSLSDDSLDFTGGTSGTWNTEQTVSVIAGQVDCRPGLHAYSLSRGRRLRRGVERPAGYRN